MISAGRLGLLCLLKNEIETSLNKNTPPEIKSACFVCLECGDETRELYFVKNPVYLNNMAFVTPNSPLGNKMTGKWVGDTVKIDGKEYIIEEIE